MSACPIPTPAKPQSLEDTAAPLRFQAGRRLGTTLSGERVLDFAQRFGVEVIQDAEILHLHMAIEDRDETFDLAQSLIERFGGLAGVCFGLQK